MGRRNYRGEGSQRIGSEPPRSSLSSLFSSGKISSTRGGQSCLQQASRAPCSRLGTPLRVPWDQEPTPALSVPLPWALNIPKTAVSGRLTGKRGRYYGRGKISAERGGEGVNHSRQMSPRCKSHLAGEKNKSYRLRGASLLISTATAEQNQSKTPLKPRSPWQVATPGCFLLRLVPTRLLHVGFTGLRGPGEAFGVALLWAVF